jgi:Bacterial oxidoreductases, C-terminal
MSIQLKAENGAICTLSLSFNNEGPLGAFFRYIGDTATYIARYDDLYTGKLRVAAPDQDVKLRPSHSGARLSRLPRAPRATRARSQPLGPPRLTVRAFTPQATSAARPHGKSTGEAPRRGRVQWRRASTR